MSEPQWGGVLMGDAAVADEGDNWRPAILAIEAEAIAAERARIRAAVEAYFGADWDADWITQTELLALIDAETEAG